MDTFDAKKCAAGLVNRLGELDKSQWESEAAYRFVEIYFKGRSDAFERSCELIEGKKS